MPADNSATAIRARVAKSEALHKSIVELREQGLTVKQVTEALGVSRRVVQRAQLAAGIVSDHAAKLRNVSERRERILELSRQGLTADTIAEMLKVHPRTVYLARKRAGLCTPRRDATEDDKLRAKQLLMDGCSYQEVARTIGFGEHAVARWFPGFQFTPRQAGHAATLARQARKLERLTLVEKV